MKANLYTLVDLTTQPAIQPLHLQLNAPTTCKTLHHQPASQSHTHTHAQDFERAWLIDDSMSAPESVAGARIPRVRNKHRAAAKAAAAAMQSSGAAGGGDDPDERRNAPGRAHEKEKNGQYPQED